MLKKNFGSKNLEFEKNCWSETILCMKEIWVQNFFGSNKISGLKTLGPNKRGRLFLSWPVLFGFHFFLFWPNLHESNCKWAQIGPSFRCWNMRTQILLLPCLLNPPKCLLFDLFAKKYMYGHFSKSVFPCGGNVDVYKTPHTFFILLSWKKN